MTSAARAGVERPAAIVFDCDGTLVDTEPVAAAMWREVLGRRGYEVTDADLRAVTGRARWHTHAYFAERVFGLPSADDLRPELRAEFYATLERVWAPFDDAVECLHRAVDLGVPVAVCTSSSSSHLAWVLPRLGVADLVEVTVSADDVDAHKPHPRPYLRAAELLGVAAATCTAVEDSPAGIASAKAAGMRVIAVRRTGESGRHVGEGDLDAADLVVDRLEPEHLGLA